MKSEIKEANASKRERIKELKEEMVKLQGANEEIVKQGQALQQKIMENNSKILKTQGGIEELERQLK